MKSKHLKFAISSNVCECGAVEGTWLFIEIVFKLLYVYCFKIRTVLTE